MSADALTVTQTAAVLRAAGWPEVLIPTMVAIAKAESGLRPDAINTSNRNGTVDRGLLQINSVHSGYDANKLLTDPLYNAQAGLEVYRARKVGDGLNAWSTWASWSSKERAKRIAAVNDDSKGPDVGGAVTDAAKLAVGLSPVGLAAGAAGALGDKAKDIITAPLSGLAGDILRVGLQLVLVAGGAGLVVLGVNAAASSSKTVREVKSDAAALVPLALA